MLYHVRAALTRVRELFRRRSHFAAEQDEEFSFHLEMETAENIRRGMSDADARRAAASPLRRHAAFPRGNERRARRRRARQSRP